MEFESKLRAELPFFSGMIRQSLEQKYGEDFWQLDGNYEILRALGTGGFMNSAKAIIAVDGTPYFFKATTVDINDSLKPYYTFRDDSRSRLPSVMQPVELQEGVFGVLMTSLLHDEAGNERYSILSTNDPIIGEDSPERSVVLDQLTRLSVRAKKRIKEQLVGTVLTTSGIETIDHLKSVLGVAVSDSNFPRGDYFPLCFQTNSAWMLQWDATDNNFGEIWLTDFCGNAHATKNRFYTWDEVFVANLASAMSFYKTMFGEKFTVDRLEPLKPIVTIINTGFDNDKSVREIMETVYGSRNGW